jgi:hypothetical protein
MQVLALTSGVHSIVLFKRQRTHALGVQEPHRDLNMASLENPFVPPPQPGRRWRYPGQNFVMIQQNREELSWSERTHSWVNDVPTGLGNHDSQCGKRKVLGELHHTNNLSTQDCEFSRAKLQCLPRSKLRVTRGQNGSDERQRQLPSSTRRSANNRGRPRGSRGRNVGVGRGSVRPMSDHDVDDQDDPLATSK